MSVMMKLFGVEIDHKKSMDGAEEMVVLGHCVGLDDKFQRAVLRIEDSKAVRWMSTLTGIISSASSSRALASKFV